MSDEKIGISWDDGLIRLMVRDGIYVWRQNAKNVSPEFRSREEAEGWKSGSHGPVMYPAIEHRARAFDHFVTESGKMIREAYYQPMKKVNRWVAFWRWFFS